MNPFDRALAVAKGRLSPSPTTVNTSTCQQNTPGPLTMLHPDEVVAVLLLSSVLDSHVWVVADEYVLEAEPAILRTGFPIFFFDEVEALRGKSVEELEAILQVKLVFPTSRVVQ